MGLPGKVRTQRLRDKRIKEGMCPKCGKRPLPDGYKMCHVCRYAIDAANVIHREELTSKGICYTCGQKPARPGHKKCEQCSAKDRERTLSRRNRLKLAGICLTCGHEPVQSGFQFCGVCRDRQVEQQRARKQARKEKGICQSCSNPVGPQSRVFCEKHWLKYNQAMREWKFDGNRLRALERDDFTCRICDSSSDARLAVHHVDLDSTNNALENLITLCQRCHNAITDMVLCANIPKLVEFVLAHYV